jgi:hypothetical protein
VPTYQARPRFLRDYKNLTREQAAAWESALQEMMGHRDFKTTLIYADHAPSAREAE